MNYEHLVNAWHKGIPLSTALLSLGSSDEKKALAKEETNTFWEFAKSFSDANILAKTENIDLTEAAKKIGDQKSIAEELVFRVKRRLFDKLKTGQLVAIGFEPPRRMESKPYSIPAQYLWQSINWKKNEMNFDSLHFVDVRIVEVSQFPQSDVTKLPASNSGRKSRKEYYFECFTALEQQGKLDTTKSIKTAFPNIRKWLTESHPSIFPSANIGDDKTIYRYIKQFTDLVNAKNEN